MNSKELDLWMKETWGDDWLNPPRPDRRFEHSPIYVAEGMPAAWGIYGRRKAGSKWRVLTP